MKKFPRTRVIEYRHLIIRRLAKMGMTRVKIANIVGITESGVDLVFSRKKRYQDKEKWSAYIRDYRRKNKTKLRKYYREYNAKWRKEHGYHSNVASEKRYPEKTLARKLVAKAILKGKIFKKPCFCGKKNTQAHHDDYSKPLKVRWLCKPHHQMAHGRYL